MQTFVPSMTRFFDGVARAAAKAGAVMFVLDYPMAAEELMPLLLAEQCRHRGKDANPWAHVAPR